MAGCAMIGQSVFNVKSGGRGKLYSLVAAVVLTNRIPRRSRFTSTYGNTCWGK
jgi:hypothetical protein